LILIRPKFAVQLCRVNQDPDGISGLLGVIEMKGLSNHYSAPKCSVEQVSSFVRIDVQKNMISTFMVFLNMQRHQHFNVCLSLHEKGLNGVGRADSWLPGNYNSSPLCFFLPDTKYRSANFKRPRPTILSVTRSNRGGALIGRFLFPTHPHRSQF